MLKLKIDDNGNPYLVLPSGERVQGVIGFDIKAEINDMTRVRAEFYVAKKPNV